MIQYHLFQKANYVVYNQRVHDLLRFLKADPNVQCHKEVDLGVVEKFIGENYQNENVCMIFYHQQHTDDYIFQVLQKLDQYSNAEFKLKVIFFTFDFWIRVENPYNKTIRKIFKAKNHYVVSFAQSVAQLSNFHGFDYGEFTNKYIFMNIWCAYDSAFVEFNDNPINKVCVSGVTDGYYYPERKFVLDLHDTVQLPINIMEMRSTGNSYNLRLNRYLCCFASSVHGPNIRGELLETNIVLLKYFEILAAGSLLLCPASEQEILNKMGLYSYQNCIICKLESTQSAIDYILDPKNRVYIDAIRKSGQKFAREHLNSSAKYLELKKSMERVFKLSQQ